MRIYVAPILWHVLPETRNLRFSILPKLMMYSIDKKNQQKKNEDWPTHMDGDICTVNICLCNDFKGAALRIYEKNDNNITSNNKFIDLPHNAVGHAVIHRGNVYHEVRPLQEGKRATLIVKVKTPTKATYTRRKGSIQPVARKRTRK